MAQKVSILLVDDIDGKELAEGKGETVEFSLDGTSYSIDLSNKNADAFRGLFMDYISAGRKVGRGGKKSTGAKASTASGRSDLPAVREWLSSNGYEVPARGRIKAELLEAYDAAQ